MLEDDLAIIEFAKSNHVKNDNVICIGQVMIHTDEANVYVKRLREKLGETINIETVRGMVTLFIWLITSGLGLCKIFALPGSISSGNMRKITSFHDKFSLYEKNIF